MLYCDKYLLSQSKVSEYASVHFPLIYDDDKKIMQNVIMNKCQKSPNTLSMLNKLLLC